MSYSFSLRASTKADAKRQVEAKMADVCAQQPSHSREEEQAVSAASDYIDLLPEADMDVLVSMSGSLGGTWDGAALKSVSSANVNINVSLAQRGV